MDVNRIYFGYMAKTLLNIKIDPETKREVQDLARDLGLPLSALVNAQLKQLVRERTIAFTAPFRMSRALERTLGMVEGDLKHGRNLSPILMSSREIDRYLDA